MVKLVIRQLQLDPLRTVLTALALASVIAVILIFEGFLEGIVAQSRDAVLDRGADLIITQAGVKNMTLARSILPQSARGEVEAIEGVRIAHPLTGIPVIYAEGGERAALLLFVYDTSGGPARLVAGDGIAMPRGIIVDKSFAERFGLSVGDPLVISDFAFTVSGITQGASAFFSAFGFVRFDDLIDFYFESDLAADISTFPLLGFLLVDLEDGADRDAVAASIEREVTSADVFTPEAMANEDEALSRALLGPIIGFLIAVSYVSGALVTGIIMFAAVDARRGELGVMKALGYPNRFLALAVVTEALILICVALPVGFVLARAIAAGIEAGMPLYRVPVTETWPIARTAVASVVFAVLGALMPVRLIRRLDPSLVFRG